MAMSGRKVKVALVHPPLLNLIGAATPNYISQNAGCLPPMGLLYLQAAIEHSRHESIFLDANLAGWDHLETAKQAIAHKPDLVGLQAMTFTLRDAYLVARNIKQLSPETAVIFGGPHPTIYPRETAALDVVDFAFSGEGETGFLSFLDIFSEPGLIEKMPGIASKTKGKVTYIPHSFYLDRLDSIHYPARNSCHYKGYHSVLSKFNPLTVMITSRGCPFQCIFCNRMGRTYRYHSSDYVLREIGEIVKLGIKGIFIHDDTFTLERKRVEEICCGVIERGYDISWEARTRVDLVDETLLALMHKAGCHRLSFGIESGSSKVLKSMRKNIDIERAEEVFRWCREVGIVTLADIMFGNIDEEADDIKKTFALIRHLNPDYVQFSICSPYPGTPLYEIGLKNGLLRKDVWLEFAKDPMQHFKSPAWTQNFTEEELNKITLSAYRQFYFSPLFIIKQIAKINSFSQFKAMAGAAFAMVNKILISIFQKIRSKR